MHEGAMRQPQSATLQMFDSVMTRDVNKHLETPIMITESLCIHFSS